MFTISDTVKGYLLKLAFVGICAGAVWQNFQILDAKNKRIKEQDQAITQLQGENNQLKKDSVNKAKSDTVTEVAKVAVKQEEVKAEKAKTAANVYVEKKLAEIDAKYGKMEQTPINLERKRTEISLERAKGLWLTFCLQEPEEQACK